MNSRKQANAPVSNRHSILPLVMLTSILTGAAAITGCRSSAIVPTAINNPAGSDPSDANLAPASSQPPAQNPGPATRNVRVLAAQQSYTPQQSSEQYPQQQYPQQAPAPIERQDPNQAYDNSANSYDTGEAAGYDALADASQPPPPLPEYDQPPVPEPNDLWTPGYWNYAPQGYYWVPGAWVAPPYIGALWTPAYWGYDGGSYRLHRGFWARHIGFYGGINYGFGYNGIGYSGGYWNGNDFFYNRAVNRINITNIHNVYERNVTVNNTTRVSYNGGNGGIHARPGPRELAVLREQRTPPMASQVQLREASSRNRQQFYNENHGRPAEAFATRPILAERGNQTFQQQNQHPQPISPPFNQQRPGSAFNQQGVGQQPQQQQRLDQQHQIIQNQPQSRFQTPTQQSPQTPTQQPQRPDQQRQPPQTQTQNRIQPQPQQSVQTPNQQQQQHFEPHNNHQELANPQQQDANQQRQHYQQQQQADQQRLQQQQRPSPQQAEPQRPPQQRAPQTQPQQPSQPHSEPQSRPQQTPSPQPQPRPQAQPQSRPQPQQQTHQEAPRAEPRK